MNNYCLPIIKNTKEEVLSEVNKNINDYKYFEVWLDYIKGLNNQFINNLSKKLKEKLILVFRRQNLESTKLDYKKRLDIINSLENTAVLVDLDIKTQQSELKFIKENKLTNKIIVSYHDYNHTPGQEELLKIIDQMKNYNPYIYKVSCLCNNKEDSVRLLELLFSVKEQNLKFIILGMGEKGIIVRIFGALWGNEITFAPKKLSEKSAPGQLTKEQMEEIFSKIH